MPYRMGRGDYVKGYYRGDPGLFGAIGHVFGGAIGGFLTGGPLGAIRGAISGTAKAVTSGSRTAMLAAGGEESAYTPALQKAHAQALHRGAVRTIAARSGAALGAAPAGRGGFRRAPRMNPLNVKALRRADRRARSFLRITRSIVRHYVAKAHKGKSYIHFKKKRAA